MTTSFSAGDPGAAGAGEPTSFAAPGVSTDTSGADDTTVVVEINGRKFTKADLVKKITHADEHISRLNAEQVEQRKLLADTHELVKKQLTATELLAKLKSESTMPATDPTDPAPKGLTIEDVKAALAQESAAANATATKAAADQNWKHVTETLTKAFGATVDQKVRAVAEANELTLAEAESLARSKPKAFLNLFGDLTPKAKPSLFGKGGSVNPLAALKSEGPKASSGFMTASLKDSVSILQARYKELGL